MTLQASDGFTPLVTVADAATAYIIAEALRAQADAKRRVADRLASPAYINLSAVNARNASRLFAEALHMDSVATECERQGIAAEYADAPTVTLPALRLLP